MTKTQRCSSSEKISKKRCFGDALPLYAEYHDREWGIPIHDDQSLFEFLILEGAQAGLNWETILKKRKGYRALFHNFDPKRVAAMTDADLETLTQNPAIIRNRRKIYGARQNAAVFLSIQKEFGTFDRYVWQFVKNKPIVNQWKSLKEIPPESPESIALSKDLKKRGMTFVGPTIIYAYMQAVGMVDDHLVDCFCRRGL
ncbi:MAG TPA: DNA-3-methyladenine glycosylase I [Rhabdochlamydiaceae bacterium]|jgi:DNA-3-methyladenine glycosylase I